MDLGKQLKIKGEKVLLIGNRTYKNLGDGLILLGVVKLLLEQDKQIYISANNVSWVKSFLNQFIDTEKVSFLKEAPRTFGSFIKFVITRTGRTLKKYEEMDSVIVCGGEILTEEDPETYKHWILSLWPSIKSQNKPNIYLMGGIQVPQKAKNKRLFNYLMKNVDYVYSRDLESVYELKKYGFENAEFFMDTSYFAYDWDSVNEKNIRQKYVVINVNKNGEKFLDDIIHDVKYYLDAGYRIVYVPVAKGKSERYNDLHYLKKIKQICKKDDKFDVLDREENFGKFAEKIANAEVVISTRLHLFLISNFLGVRTKVYPYQKKILKMQDVLRNINVEVQ